MRIFGSRRRKAGPARRADGARGRAGGGQDLLAELDELMRVNRERRDPELARRLVRLRHEAFGQLGGSGPSPAEPSGASNGSPQGVPVIRPEELSAERVRAAIVTSGCVHVPGLVPAERAKELAHGIDRTFAACDARSGDGSATEAAPADEGWYEPFKPSRGWRLGGGRKWNRDGGAIWAADSPLLMFDLLDTFEAAGVRELVTGYLGERPALSMNKSVLRRVSPETSGADWHQDGAFLGSEIRSLNVWLTLSRCGDVAPGMDVVPRRLEEIVETGSEGANFDWSVSPAVIERVAGGAGVARPIFEAGDALLFDHLFLHRTASDPGMTRDRYAVETWFFAPSAYPAEQVPLVL